MATPLRHHPDRDIAAGLLEEIRTADEEARQAEVRKMVACLEWIDMHPVDTLTQAATVPGTEGEVAIAGQGAPLVAEFAVVELATALGRSADSARMWLGCVMEVRYRLPQV